MGKCSHTDFTKCEILCGGKRYHKYLEIRNNEFWCYDKRLINAANIEEIIIKDNVIHQTDAFPPIEGNELELESVMVVDMDNNRRIK